MVSFNWAIIQNCWFLIFVSKIDILELSLVYYKLQFILGTTIILVISALCGIKVMRRLSAVHVVVFNTSRSVIVWAISLALSWQTFQVLQIVGFLFIVLGVMVFNDILIGKISHRSIEFIFCM